eukprot:2998972-Rhodomonas_salina.1
MTVHLRAAPSAGAPGLAIVTLPGPLASPASGAFKFKPPGPGFALPVPVAPAGGPGFTFKLRGPGGASDPAWPEMKKDRSSGPPPYKSSTPRSSCPNKFRPPAKPPRHRSPSSTSRNAPFRSPPETFRASARILSPQDTDSEPLRLRATERETERRTEADRGRQRDRQTEKESAPHLLCAGRFLAFFISACRMGYFFFFLFSFFLRLGEEGQTGRVRGEGAEGVLPCDWVVHRLHTVCTRRVSIHTPCARALRQQRSIGCTPCAPGHTRRAGDLTNTTRTSARDPVRNRIQKTAFLVQNARRLRFLVFDFGVESKQPRAGPVK